MATSLNARRLEPPPVPGPEAGQAALRALLGQRSMLASLEALHGAMGNVFQMPLPGFRPVFLVGPEANRFVLITGREDLRWRPDEDPVTRLLRQGLLVTDGEFHDHLRHTMVPALHKNMLAAYVQDMLAGTTRVCGRWQDGQRVDMLVEMRRVALLILMDSLFKVDFSPEMPRLWPAILRTLAYISPGLWLVLPGLPRPGYHTALQKMDDYLYQIIAARRRTGQAGSDLLGLLIASGMQDGLIRDQLLTMLIAGHDTSTALLAWAFYLMGAHPDVMALAQAEVDHVLDQAGGDEWIDAANRMEYLEQVINEALRLYPPIHIGNRMAACDLEFQGYHIPAGTRVVYSIYLTHRMPEYWPEPHRFDPQRFSKENSTSRPHYTYLPFGGGPRNCIGMAFARLEAKVVLASLLSQYHFKLEDRPVHAHMGATLEPRPGVWMQVWKRKAHGIHSNE